MLMLTAAEVHELGIPVRTLAELQSYERWEALGDTSIPAWKSWKSEGNASKAWLTQ